MNLPAIVVNFKTYPSVEGRKGLELAKMHARMAREKNVTIAVAVQAVDLRLIAQEVDIPVFAQHFDVSDRGAFTGHVTPHALKDAGAFGSLINHAEKKLPMDQIEKSINLARSLDLFTIVCAESVYSAEAIAKLDPDLVAVEPPELIGGDVSVSSAQPQLIIDAVSMVGKDKVIVGAGVKTKKDVQTALHYGAGGILVASGVVKAADPEKALADLVDGVLEPLKAGG